MPGPGGSTSVFRTLLLTEAAIWALGDLRVAEPGGRRVLGRGDVRVADVLVTKLRVEADDSPPKHAAIVGWPIDKDARMALAQQLAASATLMLRA